MTRNILYFKRKPIEIDIKCLQRHETKQFPPFQNLLQIIMQGSNSLADKHHILNILVKRIQNLVAMMPKAFSETMHSLLSRQLNIRFCCVRSLMLGFKQIGCHSEGVNGHECEGFQSTGFTIRPGLGRWQIHTSAVLSIVEGTIIPYIPIANVCPIVHPCTGNGSSHLQLPTSLQRRSPYSYEKVNQKTLGLVC